MKQIPLLQGKALLIEMPEGATDAKINPVNSWRQEIACWDGHRWKDVSLPKGNWRIIGMLSEVTESEAAGLVERFGDITWLDYITKLDCHSALESLESAIIAERYYLDKNPIPPFNERLNDWIDVQSRVLCRERCLLLGRGSI